MIDRSDGTTTTRPLVRDTDGGSSRVVQTLEDLLATDLRRSHRDFWRLAFAVANLSASTPGKVEQIEQQFKVLVAAWRQQTGGLSSPIQKALHLDYLKIIAMGKPILPFILRDLRDHGGQWYSALEAIANVNPITNDAVGSIPGMKAAWLEWGRSEGLI